jgi:hypothetical protein
MPDENESAFGLEDDGDTENNDTANLAAGAFEAPPSDPTPFAEPPATAVADEPEYEPALVQDAPAGDIEAQMQSIEEMEMPKDRADMLRNNHERPKSWAPPSLLTAPKPPPGYHHRWIRCEVRNVWDSKNVSARFREGYEPVVRQDYPDFVCPTIEDGKHAGVFMTGGLMLCRIPVEIVKQRNGYFERRNEQADQAVDNDLLKANDPRMPFDQSQRNTRVTFGAGRASA